MSGSHRKAPGSAGGYLHRQPPLDARVGDAEAPEPAHRWNHRLPSGFFTGFLFLAAVALAAIGILYFFVLETRIIRLENA
ncbi:MAG: hypothetical protein ABSE87_13255 [Terracidiphilus sp.]